MQVMSRIHLKLPRSERPFVVMVIVLAAAALAGKPTQVAANPPKESPAPRVEESKARAPAGMVWIPAGEFVMGTDDPRSRLNERPAHRVRVSGAWMDLHAVTNAEFAAFVNATRYLTTAEKPVDWDELKKQVPPDTPKPDAEMLKPGSLVFTPPDHAVDLRDMSGWWTWTPGADWRHRQGPKSSIEGKDNYPVVEISAASGGPTAKPT